MKRTLVVAGLLISVGALADEPWKPPSQINFVVSDAEAILVIRGLRRLPTDENEVALGKIIQQYQAQITPPKPTAPPVEPKQ